MASNSDNFNFITKQEHDEVFRVKIEYLEINEVV